jgi:hypothetical protein
MAAQTFQATGRVEVTQISKPFWDDVLAASQAGQKPSNAWAPPPPMSAEDGDVWSINVNADQYHEAIRALITVSDGYLRVGAELIPTDGSMSEQIHR